ncbi:uncharacterized protein C8Q71DRAFT_106368 [Rhodofomes roseus]|uniref:RING-type E3 ubiquitin transferase n=1 Tax=Rhodofomes roseus TaxID=34475 RepID=A0ABQ8KCC6_9APHY|nr:uncharacterized protein C8Q71DRAFT_106368 [Rhodofomes roseus]KAH9835146.1 hypothetical protein C8Q71DRAFT_106368 [Rhodofomes roseus]
MVRSRLNAIDNRPARRYPIICLDNLRGRCRNEEHCPRTHVLSGPNSSSMTSPLEKSHGLPPPPSERVGLACNAKSEPPAPTPSTRDVCMNWLFRDTCLNGASCMYEHPPKSGSMRPGPAVDVSSGTVTPMPTGGSNIRGYIPAESRQPESLNLGGAADVVTLSRTPERTVPSTNLHPDTTDRERRPQGTTAGDLLLDLRRNAKGSTHTSHSSASEKPGPSQIRLQQGEIPASTSTSTPYETAARDAFSALSHRAGGSSSYYEVYGLTFANLRASNVGPRLRQQRPESQGDHGGGVPAHTSRVNVPIEHAETSSDTSYYSAEYGSDPSVDAAQSSNTSFDLSQTPAEPSQPVCWDFLHGECTRHVCRFRHEEFDPRKETLSTERRRQVSGVRRSDTYPSRGDHTAKNSSTRIPGSTSSAGHHDTSHDLPKSDQPGRAEPFAAPALPPGLGLETRRPNPGLTAQRKEPPANITLSVLDSTRVTYGPGFVVQSVVTGFETRQVVLKDLPVDVTPADVTAVLKAHGEVASVYLPDPGKRGVATARVTFASSEQAVTAVSALDGTEVFGTTISARMWSGQSSLLGKARLADGDVLFEFPCAHKTGYIGYPSRALAEKAIAHANNTEVKGNWVTAEMHEGIPMVGAFTVRLRGLPASTQVKDLGRYGKSEGVMLERPNYDSSKVAIHRLRVILDNFGSMFSFNVLPPPYKRGTIRAYGQFETPAAAETVCAALHNRRQPFCGHGTLFATHISTLVYELPPAVFDALSSDIRLLNAFIWNTFEPGSSISIVDKRATVGPRCPVRVKLAAQRMPALTRMKSHFDRLLRGERVEQDGEIMWDSFFARRPGIFFLEELQRRHTGVLINRDIGRHILTLFGPEPKRAAVRSAIVSRVDELRRQNCHVIPLPGRLVGLFWGADLAALRRQFGEENVSLDPVARALKVRGDDVAHEAALLAVKQARERHVSERQQPQVECPVCFNEVTNPVKLGCGHTWCKTCLQSYLRASVDNTAFPLLCLGDEARCSSQVPIHIAQEVLSTNDFMSVVEASFRAYVHSRPSEYQYCPTPDCSQVYRRTSSNNTLQCPSCLVRICPKCNSEAHERSPCQYNEASDRLLFDDWKGSHDVKDCPSCKAPIEREAGCNHMMCIRCKTHICWACLATFDTSGEVYEHMRLIHGGIGL